MILTEEQRGALKRVAAYMDEMYSVASPYHGCTEDANLLRAMTEEQRGTVGFDLERARGLRDFLQDDCAEVGDVWAEMIAEIERLRGYEIAARDLSADLTKVAGDRDEQAAHISELEVEIAELKADLEQAERVIEARLEVIDQQAAQIKSLKKEIRRLKHESKVEQELTNSYIKHLHEAEARIKELEDAHKRSGAKYAKIINELRSSVYANIPGLDVGKIGPDAKPRSWQITEERIGLLEYCLETLLDAPDIEEIPGPGHSIEMLRAMLREAEQ